MARIKEFDVDEALEAAMRVFWSRGYEATSVADLSLATRLSRSSLYGTFSDKHDLFLRCLGYYSETIGSVFFSQLRDADAGLNTIRNCFSVLLEAVTNAPRRSCLNVNSAAELAHRDHEVRKHIRGYDRHVRSCFHAALQSAQRRGETTDGADLEAHAAHLSISAQGLLLQAKAHPPKKAVQSYVSLVLASLPERE